MFSEIRFYETGYLLIVSSEGKLLNEPEMFIEQAKIEGQGYEDLSVTQLISQRDWSFILNS